MLTASVHAIQGESNAVVPYQFDLLPPIVLVARADPDIEKALEVLAQDFGGTSEET